MILNTICEKKKFVYIYTYAYKESDWKDILKILIWIISEQWNNGQFIFSLCFSIFITFSIIKFYYFCKQKKYPRKNIMLCP